MKKIVLIAAFVVASLLFSTRAQAQFSMTKPEAIAASKEVPGTLIRTYERVYLDGRQLSLDEIRGVLSPEEWSKYRTGRTLYKVSFPFSVIGCIAAWGGIACEYIYFADGDPDSKLGQYGLYATGGGLALVALMVPFEIVGLKKTDKAVDLHNARGQKVAFEPASHGFGIQVRF